MMNLPQPVQAGAIPSLTPLLPKDTAHPSDSNSSISSMTVAMQVVPNDRNRVRLWIKYSLFGFNFILWVIGSAMAGVGIWSMAQKYAVDVYKVANIQFDPAVAFLVVGVAVFITSFAGCLGALRENVTLLSVYMAIISLIFILEIVLIILLLAYKDWMYNRVEQNLQSMIVFYRDDADLQSIIDWIQEHWLQCCGVAGPDDWDANPYFNCSSPGREACGVPHSCCIPQKMQSESRMTIYNDGCFVKLQLWLGENQMPVLIASTVILAIQLSTVTLASLHYKDIRETLQQWEDPRYRMPQQILS